MLFGTKKMVILHCFVLLSALLQVQFVMAAVMCFFILYLLVLHASYSPLSPGALYTVLIVVQADRKFFSG